MKFWYNQKCGWLPCYLTKVTEMPDPNMIAVPLQKILYWFYRVKSFNVSFSLTNGNVYYGGYTYAYSGGQWIYTYYYKPATVTGNFALPLGDGGYIQYGSGNRIQADWSSLPALQHVFEFYNSSIHNLDDSNIPFSITDAPGGNAPGNGNPPWVGPSQINGTMYWQLPGLYPSPSEYEQYSYQKQGFFNTTNATMNFPLTFLIDSITGGDRLEGSPAPALGTISPIYTPDTYENGWRISPVSLMMDGVSIPLYEAWDTGFETPPSYSGSIDVTVNELWD